VLIHFPFLFADRSVCGWLGLLLAVQLLASEISLILAHGQLFPTKIGVKIPPICGEILG
jgi:hypothetical protein